MGFFKKSDIEEYRKAYNYEHGIGVAQNPEKAFKYYQRAAGHKNVRNSDAECKLGDCYYYGVGTEVNYLKAFKMYSKSAELNHPRGTLMLAQCYAMGHGVAMDEKSVPGNLMAAVRLGADVDEFVAFLQERKSYSAIMYLARQYCDLGDHKKAFELLTVHEEAENPEIDIDLAKLYLDGLGTNQNVDLAVQLYERAAKRNYYAAFCLADLYERGEYVPRDVEKAAQYYMKSIEMNISHPNIHASMGMSRLANEGNISAIYNLYLCHTKGLFPYEKPYDRTELLIRAADGGHTIAQGKIAEYFYKHKKDYEKTVKYAVPAAEQGDKLGELYLGICYYYGRGIDKNLEKAFALFKSAAEKDSGKALHWMGYLYENGIFVDKDLEKALKYYTEAADNGVLDVQVMLANRYYKGMHVTKDIEKAKHYYHLAALRESPEGMYGYGQCLYNALNSDDSEALYWFKKAADKGIASAMSAIAECYFSNRGQVEFFSEKKRYEAAIKWAKKAKEHGDSIADIRLERYERAIKQLEFNERKRAEAASLPTSSFSDCSSTVGSVDSMEYVKNNLPSVWTPGGIETVRNDPNLSESEKEEILDKYRIYSD